MWLSFFAYRSGYLHKGGMGNCQALTKFYFDFYLSIALFITSAHLQFISSAFFPLPLMLYRADLSRNLLFGGPALFYWVFQHCIFFTLHTPSGLLLHTFLVSKQAQEGSKYAPQDMGYRCTKQDRIFRTCNRTAFGGVYNSQYEKRRG